MQVDRSRGSHAVAYPPKVFPVSIFRQSFFSVAHANQWSETCALWNLLSAGHSEHLFSTTDMESSEQSCKKKKCEA